MVIWTVEYEDQEYDVIDVYDFDADATVADLEEYLKAAGAVNVTAVVV